MLQDMDAPATSGDLAGASSESRREIDAFLAEHKAYADWVIKKLGETAAHVHKVVEAILADNRYFDSELKRIERLAADDGKEGNFLPGSSVSPVRTVDPNDAEGNHAE